MNDEPDYELPEELKTVDPIIDKAIADIMEHVHSVRIFVTLSKDAPSKDTLVYTVGHGNYHAQYGQIREWVIKQEHNFCHPPEDE